MSADQVEIEIAAAPSAVWAVVGDFGAIGEMIPGLESFRLEGDDRVIGMFGMEIRERLISRDDDGRALTYSIVDGVPIESHRATVSVVPAGVRSVSLSPVQSLSDTQAPSGRCVATISPVTKGEPGWVQVNQLLVSTSTSGTGWGTNP